MGLQYTWGAATDDLVAIRDTQGHHYYATTDRLGSVRTLARRDGTWQLTQRFDPHGRPLARDTAASFGLGARLRYGWTGREWDAETGFSYHRARYFDPTSRRWTQEDPIGYGGGGNLYAYAGGSPLEARDPSGLIPSAGEVRRRQEAAMVDPMAAQQLDLAARVDAYNFWLPVFDSWAIDHYYNRNGKLVGRIANWHGRSNHYMQIPRQPDRKLDYGLVEIESEYEIEENPDEWMKAARAAANERIAEIGECDRVCFREHSPEGRHFDFKDHAFFPRERLWNGGNGIYYHFDVVL